jgi:hypothetical protein
MAFGTQLNRPGFKVKEIGPRPCLRVLDFRKWSVCREKAKRVMLSLGETSPASEGSASGYRREFIVYA